MVTSLIIPFVAICIVVVMVDRLAMAIESIIHKIPYLPDKLEGPIAYAVVFLASYVICWRGGFNFFASLNFTFRHEYEGWLMTALLISGGSSFVKASFGMMSNIPQVVSGVYSTITSFFSNGQTTDTTSQSDPNLPP